MLRAEGHVTGVHAGVGDRLVGACRHPRIIVAQRGGRESDRRLHVVTVGGVGGDGDGEGGRVDEELRIV